MHWTSNLWKFWINVRFFAVFVKCSCLTVTLLTQQIWSHLLGCYSSEAAEASRINISYNTAYFRGETVPKTESLCREEKIYILVQISHYIFFVTTLIHMTCWVLFEMLNMFANSVPELQYGCKNNPSCVALL